MAGPARCVLSAEVRSLFGKVRVSLHPSRFLGVAASGTLAATALTVACNKLPTEPTGFRGIAYPVVVAFSDPDPQGNRTIIGPAWHATTNGPGETPDFDRPRDARPLSSLALEAGPNATSPPTHEITLTRRSPASQINLFVQVAGQHYSHTPLDTVVRDMQLRIPVRRDSGGWDTEIIHAASRKAGNCSVSGVPAYALEFDLNDSGRDEIIRAVVARAARRVDRGWQDLPVFVVADYRASEADVAATGPAFDRFLDQLIIEGDDYQAIGGSDCREVWSPGQR